MGDASDAGSRHEAVEEWFAVTYSDTPTHYFMTTLEAIRYIHQSYRASEPGVVHIVKRTIRTTEPITLDRLYELGHREW